MTRAKVEYRIKCLNDEMFLDSPLELITLRTSTDYTYNKAIALVDRNSNKRCWYSVNYKNCFKTWKDADLFLDGFYLAKNTNFDRICER